MHAAEAEHPAATVTCWADIDPTERLLMAMHAAEAERIPLANAITTEAIGVIDALLIVNALPGARIICVDHGVTVVDEMTPWGDGE